ncbi:MAG: glutaredoxin family protein [Betaproteobacteria bacterium]
MNALRAKSAILPVVILAAACLGGNALAQQLYKWVDADGKVTYSDVPPPKDAKNVQQKNMSDASGNDDNTPYSVRIAIERNPVVLYANACGEPCDSARALLKTRGIPYADRNPEKDPAAMDALKKATGEQQVPVLTIGEGVQKGFGAEDWNAALTSAGYPRNNPNLRPRTPPAPAPGTPGSPATSTPPSTPPVADPPRSTPGK